MLILLLLSSVSAFAAKPAATPHTIVTTSSAGLPKLVAELDPAKLDGFSFVELYFLKNAVLSAKGYEYAQDRPWLDGYFTPREISGNTEYEVEERANLRKHCVQNCSVLNLRDYQFPKVTGNNEFKTTPDMERAFAKIRQAQLARIRKSATAVALSEAVRSDFKNTDQYRDCGEEVGCFGTDVFIFGRKISFPENPGRESETEPFVRSLIRDCIGDFSLLKLVDDIKSDRYDFDQAELLGLYLGNLDLLRKVILARSGRTFDEPLKTEFIKMSVAAPAMGAGNLSAPAKKALESLDVAIARLTKGDLGDLPKNFTESNLEVDNSSLSYSVGM